MINFSWDSMTKLPDIITVIFDLILELPHLFYQEYQQSDIHQMALFIVYFITAHGL